MLPLRRPKGFETEAAGFRESAALDFKTKTQ